MVVTSKSSVDIIQGELSWILVCTYHFCFTISNAKRDVLCKTKQVNQNIDVSKTILFYFLGFSTNWKCFSEIKNENIGNGEKADYFTSKGTVIFLRKENCMYKVREFKCCKSPVSSHVICYHNGYDREYQSLSHFTRHSVW